MYYMYKGSLKNFFLAKTTHRIRKLLTLAVSASLLVTMVTIDASASALVSRKSNLVRAQLIMKVAGQSGDRQFSGRPNRWGTTTTTTPPTSTTTTTPPTSTTMTAPPTSTTTTTPPPTTPPPTTTPTTPPPTTTTKAPSTPAVSGGAIIAGPSRSECLEPDNPAGVYGLASLNSLVTNFDNLTNSNVTCLISYLNGAPSWSNWESPWITQSQFGFTAWVAQAPQVRQLVLQVDLIPDSLKNVNNPLSWEQSCAAGDFNAYATQLGTNLVAAGLQNTVLRLGAEMNGAWEADYMGSTTQEQKLWAACFANEVTGLRKAAGEHFLIDWNPNACTQSVPYANFYPGNAYVDIMGLDLYDVGCNAPSAPINFIQLANETFGLTSFEAFAGAQGKPMSFPEWGLSSVPNGDNPAYIDGIGSAVASGDFAFEAYFDAGAQGMLPLGSRTPLSVLAFQHWFGNS